MSSRAMALAVLTFAIASIGACARDPLARSVVEPVSGDSLGSLLISRMRLRPHAIELRLGQRIAVEFTRVEWADSSAGVRFDRAYDVARLLWDAYGATHGIDTISVRRTTPVPGGAASSPAQIEEFYFYPEQLTARQRPRLGASRELSNERRIAFVPLPPSWSRVDPL